MWHQFGPIAAGLKKFYYPIAQIYVEDLAMHGRIIMDSSDSG